MNIKNKLALAALIAAASSASFAGAVATAKNMDGTGLIVLTDGTSKLCKNLDESTKFTWNYAELQANDGRIHVKGCWMMDTARDVRIRWADGDDYQYGNINNFTLTPYWHQTYGEGRSDGSRKIAPAASSRKNSDRDI